MQTLNTASYNKQFVNGKVARAKTKDLTQAPNKWVAALATGVSVNRVLDIACGMAEESIRWARVGKTAVAIDFNLDMVRTASRHAESLGVRIHFVVADGTKLPFRDGSFGVCNCESLYEHVPEWQLLALEARRVLVDGGVYFVRTTNRHCPKQYEVAHMPLYSWYPERLKRHVLRWVMNNRRAWVNYTSYPAVHWFTHPGLAAYFRGIGFTTREIFDVVTSEMLSTRRKRFVAAFELLRRYPVLRYAVYPFMSTVEVMAVRNTAGATVGPTADNSGK